MADSTFNVGDIVRCERDAPAKGSWSQYAGRVGRVVVVDNHGEVGVTWEANAHRGHGQADCWFLPAELVIVG